MTSLRKRRFWLLPSATLALIACGGGGGGDSDLVQRYLEEERALAEAQCECASAGERQACTDSRILDPEAVACDIGVVERLGEEAFFECTIEQFVELGACLVQAGCDEEARLLCEPSFECPLVSEAAMLAVSEECPRFMCGDGDLVDSGSRCDGTPDCIDSSDEADCP